MADSGTKEFGSILSDGLFRIPNYQRGYAWTRDEVNDLLDDLEYVTGNDAVDDHYLNSIIVTEPRDASSTDVSHVIDGQQRLLTTALLANEVLRRAFRTGSEENQNVGQLRQNIEDKIDKCVFKRSVSRTQRRILPAAEHREVFELLVPTDLNTDRHFDAIERRANSPSEEKIVDAGQTIGNRLDELLEDAPEGSTDEDKLIYLDRLASTISDGFTATLHEVDSSSEAGRIFEAINDRGRNLNRADKIKSYLVYRATLGELDLDVEDIHAAFTDIYETLNEYADDPAKVDGLVDRLISQHWNMFSGEDQISKSDDLVGRHERAGEDLSQIKHAKYHAPKDRDDERVERWIEVYLDSLRDAAEAYVHVRGTDQDELFSELQNGLAEGADASDVRHHLYALETFGPSTVHSLLIAVYVRFLGDAEFQSITAAFEKLVLRMFGVNGARRDTKRNDFESLSRALFWTARDDLTDVFPEDSSIPTGVSDDAASYGIEGSVEDAKRVVELVEEWTHSYSHGTDDNGEEVDKFEERLREENLDGLGVAGWGGLRTSEIKNYLLYRYEAEIRSGGVDLPDYLDGEIDEYTVEHVWPQNRADRTIADDLDDDTYAHYVERLGNLAFLSLSENASASNHEYGKKWTQTYDNASDGTKMVREEFPDPTGERSNHANERGFETWSTDVIEWRSKRMAEVLADYWSCSL